MTSLQSIIQPTCCSNFLYLCFEAVMHAHPCHQAIMMRSHAAHIIVCCFLPSAAAFEQVPASGTWSRRYSLEPLVPQPARQVHCAEEAAPGGADMPGGQAVGLGTQSLRLSEPTALVVPKGHAKQGSLVRPVEYVPTGHWWQLSPVRPESSRMPASRHVCQETVLMTCQTTLMSGNGVGLAACPIIMTHF